MVGYCLLGSTWLIMKTEGDLQQRARVIARRAAFGTLALIGIVSLWTPFLQTDYMARWFAWPNMLYVLPIPLLLLVGWVSLLRGLKNKREFQPFLSANGLFILCFVGLGINFYPNIVPPSVTFWAAAGPDKSLAILLAGAVVLIPLILLYTGYAYWTFLSKVDPEAGYH